MCGRGLRRVCALVAVVALLSASVDGRRPPTGCQSCPPDCPMHARRLGCHHATGPRCHSAGGAGALTATCGHAAHADVTHGLRATLAPRVRAVPVFAPHRLAFAAPVPVSAPPLEPPTDPPRASLA